MGIGVFDVGKLKAYEGGDLVRLGRYREAEPVLDAAIKNLAPSMHRHRCTAFIDRAEARIAAGHVDDACADGAEALYLVTQVQHVGNMQRLTALARRARDTGTSAGRDLWLEVLTAHPRMNGTMA